MSEKIRERAQQGLGILSDAVRDFVFDHPEGLRNDEVARALGLESSFNGGQRNYLTHAVLNGLVQHGQLVRDKRGSRVYYMPDSKTSAT